MNSKKDFVEVKLEKNNWVSRYKVRKVIKWLNKNNLTPEQIDKQLEAQIIKWVSNTDPMSIKWIRAIATILYVASILAAAIISLLVKFL